MAFIMAILEKLSRSLLQRKTRTSKSKFLLLSMRRKSFIQEQTIYTLCMLIAFRYISPKAVSFRLSLCLSFVLTVECFVKTYYILRLQEVNNHSSCVVKLTHSCKGYRHSIRIQDIRH